MARKNREFTCDDVIRFFCKNLPTEQRLTCRVRLVGDFCEEGVAICAILEEIVDKGGAVCDIIPSQVLKLLKRLSWGKAVARAIEILCASVNLAYIIHSLACEKGGEKIGYEEKKSISYFKEFGVIGEEARKAIAGNQIENQIGQIADSEEIILLPNIF